VSHVVHQTEVKNRNCEVKRGMDGNPGLLQQQQQRELQTVATGFATITQVFFCADDNTYWYT
jgi:hypothetical protein